MRIYLPGPENDSSPGAPLFHAAWLFALGIAAAHWLWMPPVRLLLALFGTALVVAFSAWKAPHLRWLPVALLWPLLGAWCAETEPQPAPEQPLAQLSNGLLRKVEGVVVLAGPLRKEANAESDSANQPTETTQSIHMQLTSLEVVDDRTDEQKPVTGTVNLTLRWPVGTTPQAYTCGSRLQTSARLLEPVAYHDDGVWNRADYLLTQQVTATASVPAESVHSIGVAAGGSLHCRLHSLQYASTAHLQQMPLRMRSFPALLRLSQADVQLLAAMVAGDRTLLNRSLRVGFERTGSFHMLVVSGFHLAIVAGFFFWIATLLRMPRHAATLLTLAASLAYALFTGFATPVQRSLWMVTIYLLTRLLYRERSVLNTIGLAALVLLAVSPRSLFESSLQMTLLAVLVIGGIAAPLLQSTLGAWKSAILHLSAEAPGSALQPHAAQLRIGLRMIAGEIAGEHPGRVRRWLAWRCFPALSATLVRALEWLVVSCVIELAMTLPMAIYFHRITLFALPVNLLILPLLLILLPLALLLLAVLCVWPAAAVVPAAAVAAVLHFSVAAVSYFSQRTMADLRISTPQLWQCSLFVALLGISIFLAQTRHMRKALVILLLSAVVAVLPPPLQHPQNALFVEAIDVGQGDALLLISPEGKTLLVDAGGFGGGPRSQRSEYDVGEEVVSTVLWQHGIRHLDAVALTHAHSDHMGGMPAVLRNFHPDVLWVGSNPPVPPYEALLQQASAQHVPVQRLQAGQSLQLGSLQIHVLAPLPEYRPADEPQNNDSLVLRVVAGKTSVLLEGDAEAPVERAMLAEELQSTLLKVGHHGSLTSSMPEFLARVHPQWAVISCGLRNRYGHPREEILTELQNAGVRTLSTDISGPVCFRLDASSGQVSLTDCSSQ